MRNPKYIPVLFAVLTVVTYGLLLPFMGFYWDDWPFAWIQNFLGPREFIPAFEPFRPFLPACSRQIRSGGRPWR